VRLLEQSPITRDDMMQSLLDRGISTRRGVMPIHRELPYANGDWNTRLPETNKAADRAIILPLFDQMSDDDQDYVLESIMALCRPLL